MTDKSTFRGSVEVHSNGDGYAVGFDVETDAHDLGHALAAIIQCYVDVAQRQVADDAEELKEIVMEGIACAMRSPPELQLCH